MSVSSAAQAQVHFLDIASKLKGSEQSWSPNTMKTRLALNHKQIPYTTSFLSYPDIKPALESSHFAADGLLSKGGKGPWTLPAICPPPVDKAGGSSDGGCPALNDSFAIALALDSRFPSTESSRQLFPDRASLAFARVVQGLFNAGITQKGLILWIRFIPSHLLDDRGAAYFTRTREESFGRPLNQVGTPDDRAKDLQSLIEALKPITQALAAHEQDGLEGSSSSPYLMGGDQPTYADMIVLGFLAWAHRAELAAGDAVEPKGGWFTTLLEADGGGLGRLWEAGRELVEGQGLGVVEWKA